MNWRRMSSAFGAITPAWTVSQARPVIPAEPNARSSMNPSPQWPYSRLRNSTAGFVLMASTIGSPLSSPDAATAQCLLLQAATLAVVELGAARDRWRLAGLAHLLRISGPLSARCKTVLSRFSFRDAGWRY